MKIGWTSATARRSIGAHLQKPADEGAVMQIDIKGRNVPVTDAIREHAARRLDKVARQVSDLARLEIEIFEERNPSIAEREVVEATLYLKGVTLRAHEHSREMGHSLNLVVDELARQVKRHRDKRRKRREAHAAATQFKSARAAL
jgi:putative sigma-54 modulation protein